VAENILLRRRTDKTKSRLGCLGWGIRSRRFGRYRRFVNAVPVLVVCCAECGTSLFEQPFAPLESREPCPVCGSTARRVRPFSKEDDASDADRAR